MAATAMLIWFMGRGGSGMGGRLLEEHWVLAEEGAQEVHYHRYRGWLPIRLVKKVHRVQMRRCEKKAGTAK